MLILTFIAFYLLTYVFYFYAIFGSFEKVYFCCDAAGYIRQSDIFIRDGFGAHFDWVGYRSYLNYAMPALLRYIGFAFGFAQEELASGTGLSVSVPFAFGSFAATIAFGIGLILAFYEQPGFKRVFVPLMMNPFLFAYIPFPLQETTLVTFIVPLVALIVLLHPRYPLATAPLTGFLAGFLWMAKSSLLLVAGPVLVVAVAAALFYGSDFRTKVTGCLAALIAFAVPIIPQMYSSLVHFSTWWPYPNTAILNNQFAWGWGWWKYDTYYSPDINAFRGLPYRGPTQEISGNKFHLPEMIFSYPLRQLQWALATFLRP